MTLTGQPVNSVWDSLHWLFSTSNCNPGHKQKWVLVVQEHLVLLLKSELYLFPCTPLRWVIWFWVDLSCSVWMLFATRVYRQEQLHVYQGTSSKHSRLLWLQHLAIDKVLEDKTIICVKHVYCKSTWHITKLLIKTKVFFPCQSKWGRAIAWNLSLVISSWWKFDP